MKVKFLKEYSTTKSLINPTDEVIYTCKIHGTSARYVFWDGKFHCGSRTTWKKEPGTPITYTNKRTGETIDRIVPNNSWHEAAKQNPWIEEWCRANPGAIVYGEVYGQKVQGQKFTYGLTGDQLGFRAFDVLEDNKWIDNVVLHTDERYKGLKKVPVLYRGVHNKELMETLAESDETFEGGYSGIREGVVLKPVVEKIHWKVGRVSLKYVSNRYLMKS